MSYDVEARETDEGQSEWRCTSIALHCQNHCPTQLRYCPHFAKPSPKVFLTKKHIEPAYTELEPLKEYRE